MPCDVVGDFSTYRELIFTFSPSRDRDYRLSDSTLLLSAFKHCRIPTLSRSTNTVLLITTKSVHAPKEPLAGNKTESTPVNQYSVVSGFGTAPRDVLTNSERKPIVGTNMDSTSRTSDKTTCANFKQDYPAGNPPMADMTPTTTIVTNSDTKDKGHTPSIITSQASSTHGQPISPALDLVPYTPITPSSADLDVQVTPTRPDKFTLFPKLPAELRLRVWKEAYPDPRWIEVCVEEWWTSPLTWSARCATDRSPLFAVCHESRVEILKTHQYLCGNRKDCCPVAFDAEKDTLVFRRINFIDDTDLEEWSELLPTDMLGNIRSIVWEADPIDSMTPERQFEGSNAEGLRLFPRLKTVQIAMYNGEHHEHIVVGYTERPMTETYTKTKARFNKGMKELLSGQADDDASQKKGASIETKDKYQVEVSIGNMVLVEYPSRETRLSRHG